MKLFPGHLPFAAVAVLGLLSACSKDNRQADTKLCIANSEQMAAQGQLNLPPDASAEDRHDRIGAEVAACMEGRGYRHDDGAMTDQRCVNDVDYNAFCYARRT